METIELHVFFTVVSVRMLMHNRHCRRLERERQQLTRRSQDSERQPVSTLAFSPVQPAAISLPLSALTPHFDNTPPCYLHVTTLQWRRIHHMTSAYSLCIITRSSLNALPIHLWKWIDLMSIRCASEWICIRCEHAKPNSMRIESGSKC